MKKYLLGMAMLMPFLALAQDNPPAALLLGLSVNRTVTGTAYNQFYSNRPTSSYIFPEAHVTGDFALDKKRDMLFRLEGSLTYQQVKYTLEGNNGYTKYLPAYKIDELRLTINPQFLYIFNPGQHASFYTAAGIAVTTVSANNRATDNSSIQGSSFYVSGTEEDSTSWFSVGGNLKAGFFIGKNLDVYLDFVKPFAVAHPTTVFDFDIYNPSQTTRQSIFKVGVNYRLQTHAASKRPLPPR